MKRVARTRTATARFDPQADGANDTIRRKSGGKKGQVVAKREAPTGALLYGRFSLREIFSMARADILTIVFRFLGARQLCNMSQASNPNRPHLDEQNLMMVTACPKAVAAISGLTVHPAFWASLYDQRWPARFCPNTPTRDDFCHRHCAESNPGVVYGAILWI